MKGFIVAVLLCVLYHTVRSRSDNACKVNIYTRHLGVWEKENVLICHVSKISPPPEIRLDLLKNGVVIPNTNQSDLAFDGEWEYYLTKHVDFTPLKGERYTCRVCLNGKTSHYEWEPDE
ncbi:beta-2-microglobulin-like [Halichoeres trimaculatus]|uniref:beta-2-microglobulin-like n=1 Tax=Halichoeres trimaculatus TaxID=147232 RepID=UPI003D9FA173